MAKASKPESYTSFTELLEDCVPIEAEEIPKDAGLLSRLLSHRPPRRDSQASGLQRWLDSEPCSPIASPTLTPHASPSVNEPSSSLDSFFSLSTPPSSPVRLNDKRTTIQNPPSPRPSPRTFNSTPNLTKRKPKPKTFSTLSQTRANDPIQALFGPLVPAKSFIQLRTVSMPSLARSASVKGSLGSGKLNPEKVEMRFEARSARKRRANTLDVGAEEMLCGLKRISTSSRPSSRGAS